MEIPTTQHTMLTNHKTGMTCETLARRKVVLDKETKVEAVQKEIAVADGGILSGISTTYISSPC